MDHHRKLIVSNFLGIIELLSHYDPLLREHVTKVAESQKIGKRLSAHYFSADSQNEFISACAHHVRQEILAELRTTPLLLMLLQIPPILSKLPLY